MSVVRARVEFRLFGPVEAWCGGQRVELGQPRLRATLAVLLTEANRVVSPATLVERVWGAHPPDSARSALYGHLTRIRAVLARLNEDGEAVRLTRVSGGYLLKLDPATVDLHLFDRLVDQARATRDADQAAALWATALDLWGGDPYENLSSEWLDEMRDKLKRRRLTAVLERNELELARGRHAELLAELIDLGERQPLDERLAGQLMLAHYRCGQRAEAMRYYETVRQRLADELGVEPGVELQALHEQMVHNAPPVFPPSAHVPAPAQLPPDVPGFVGRAEELARLDALRAQRAGHPAALIISAVSGTAGIGKTTLAVHWAHRVSNQFPDGQLYVNLCGFRSGPIVTPSEAIRGFLEALGVPPERIPLTIDAQVSQYRSLMDGKRVLVVLDNARDAEQVRPLLPGTPTALVVVTSRNQLTPLVAIEGARPLTVDLLSDGEARELVVRRLGADRVAAEPHAVNRIITGCARLPLALAVAAARAQQTNFPLTAIAAGLDKAGQRLDTLDAGDPASQVRAVFSWSYAALTLPGARLFRLLGLNSGPDISIPAAASLAGLPRAAEARVLLTELAHANLVTEHAPGRYTFHDLLREYASELTQRHDSIALRQAAQTRLLDHYTRASYAADHLLYPDRDPISLPLTPAPLGTVHEIPRDHHEALAWFATEHRSLLAALRLAVDARLDSHAWQLAWTLDTFLDRQGHWHDLAAAWQAAVPAAQRLGDPVARADAHRFLGYANTRLDRHSDANTHLSHALDLYTQAADRVGQARTHDQFNYLWERLGRPEKALDHAGRALALYQAAGHRRGQARALNAVGWLHAVLGDYTRALTHCEQALALHRQLGDRVGEAATWDSLGYAHHHLGDHTRAADCYQHALTQFRDLGDRYYEADTLIHLGETHHAAGNPQGARSAWRQALDILTNLEHPDAEGVRAKLRVLDPFPAAAR
jgi:DNA-binding SARP family transcriptional activator/tetratricopeptide (TPR) repeat protein